MGHMVDLSFHSQLANKKKSNWTKWAVQQGHFDLDGGEVPDFVFSFSVHSLKCDDSALKDVGGVIFLWFGFSVGSVSTPICSSTSSFSSPSVFLPTNHSQLLFLNIKTSWYTGVKLARIDPDEHHRPFMTWVILAHNTFFIDWIKRESLCFYYSTLNRHIIYCKLWLL